MSIAASTPRTRSASPRDRILAAFEERARTGGIRGVVLSELARELGISKKTLYQHFSSKEKLVRAMIDEVMERMHERSDELETLSNSPKDLMTRWAEEVLDGEQRYTRVFWEELETDYPSAHTAMRAELEVARERAQGQLSQHLRSDVTPEIALATYEAIVAQALDTDLCERLHLTRQESVLAALEIWARGALETHARPHVTAPKARCAAPGTTLLKG